MNNSASAAFEANSAQPHVPKVIMICPTFRKEGPHAQNDESYRARYQGLVSLYEQFCTQDYPSDKIELRIADSSAIPHAFFKELNDPRFKYLHVPARDHAAKMSLSARYPEAAQFMLTDDELSSESVRTKIDSLQRYCSRKRDPVSAEWIPSIPDPLQVPRPSIGMKRNMLCAIPFTADGGVGEPDIIIAVDDDDWRSTGYTKQMVDALQDSDWTKLVNYHLALFISDKNDFLFGKKEFQLEPCEDRHNLPAVVFSERAIMYKKDEGFKYGDPAEIFNSPRWHPLSTDGAVHAMRYSAWKRTVDLCGGYSPVSYNEDTLMFESLRLLGHLRDAQDVMRHELVLSGLIGNKKFTEDEIAQDFAAGAIRFNPQAHDDYSFVRLCCANVSPVALSKIVKAKDLPASVTQVFNYILDGSNNTSSQTLNAQPQPQGASYDVS